jgi:acyl-CoA synthetase (AMP-forming)/AMP-acid ligase II
MVSHVNVIAHMLMVDAFERPTRSAARQDVILGLLPQSHIYGLVVISHDGVYRGDSIVVLPKFELKTLLESIQRYKINVLIMVNNLHLTFVGEDQSITVMKLIRGSRFHRQ